MNYLIILLVIALVVAPVFWIMPSPRQKRQARLRQLALQQGLQLKVCDLPQTHRAAIRREAPRHGMLYRLPWPGRERTELAYLRQGEMLCLRTAEGVEWRGDPPARVLQAIEARLRELPQPVKALAVSLQGIGCYWTEQGDEALVESIAGVLHELRRELINLH